MWILGRVEDHYAARYPGTVRDYALIFSFSEINLPHNLDANHWYFTKYGRTWEE